MAEDDIPGEPHSTRLVVWGVPSTVESGEKFSVRLGLKCSSACRPEGWAVEVRDQDGTRQATATVGGERWTGTDALYHAEVELRAPEAVGLHAWEAMTSVGGLDPPHADSVISFGVRVVPTPDCLLTVVAVDAESESPVEGARVVAHPYEAATNELGVAAVRLPAGTYRLFVSGKDFLPFRTDCEVAADATIRAELALDRELSDVDLWY